MRNYFQITKLLQIRHTLLGKNRNGFDLSRVPNFRNIGTVKARLSEMRQHLFPWLNVENISNFKGKGIVISTGNDYAEYAALNIAILRNILRCRLPIEIAYGGPDDLSPQNIRLLQSFENVSAFDVYERVDNSLVEIGGWSLKPFAMLFSSFQEVIFMDADVLFIQDPAHMFSFEGYARSGSIFFHDRQMNWGKTDTHDWANEVK